MMRDFLNGLQKKIMSQDAGDIIERGINHNLNKIKSNQNVTKMWGEMNFGEKVKRTLFTVDDANKTVNKTLIDEHISNGIQKKKQDALDAISKIQEKGNGEAYQKAIEYQQKRIKALEQMSDLGVVESGGLIGDKVSDYLYEPGMVGKRMGALAGGYVGASIALRYERGGSITRNPEGRKDIAVIPFI